jgi:hypothetical protein
MAIDMPERQGRKIFLLSCVKSKQPFRTRAADLYTSALFKKMLRYAQCNKPDEIFILSAKYGLLARDDMIDPYEQTLNNMPVAERRDWAQRVLRTLRDRVDLERDQFTILAGDKYRSLLLPHLRHYSIPMEGLAFGQQLRFLTKEVKR